LETALELRALKNIYNVQKVAFLFDSAIGGQQKVQDNVLNERMDNATNIFRIQRALAGIFQVVMNVPNVFLIQYDTEAAW